MTLRHTRDGTSDRTIVLATAGAIRSLESVISSMQEYQIGPEDAQDLHYIMGRLWSILESNGYTINTDTNRLRRHHHDRLNYPTTAALIAETDPDQQFDPGLYVQRG